MTCYHLYICVYKQAFLSLSCCSPDANLFAELSTLEFPPIWQLKLKEVNRKIKKQECCFRGLCRHKQIDFSRIIAAYGAKVGFV